jgi:formyl-CoA transferase
LLSGRLETIALLCSSLPIEAECELQGQGGALANAVAPRVGSRSTTASPRNVYECSDGKFVALLASMQSMAERLFRAMGREDLIDNPRYKTNSEGVRNVPSQRWVRRRRLPLS